MKDILFAEELRNKTIMITGATGMVGRSVVSFLMKLNEKFNAQIKIVACVRDKAKAENVFKENITSTDFVILVSDISCIEFEDTVDFIVHAAFVTGGSKQHLDCPMRTISVALDGTRCVLEMAREKKAGIVFLSSLEVYGNTGLGKDYIYETDGGYIDPMNVRSSYSESKRMCECMFASYAKQYGVQAMVARLTASFGRGVSYMDNRVFAQFAKSIINHEDIVLKSTGETVRNYCDVEDVATALITILLKGEPGEAYNVANMETEISIRDLAERFIALYPECESSLCFDLSVDATKFGYNSTMRNVLNSDKLMSLGWAPRYSIDDMITHLVDEFMMNKAYR